MATGEPLIQDKSLGNIDPTLVTENSTEKIFVVWKVDGNGHVPPLPTPIYAQEIVFKSDKGIPVFSLVGNRTELIHETLPWEGNLVEGPWVIFAPHFEFPYFLFYSANAYYNASYAVGVARSKNLLGPYEKHPSPILHSNSAWYGPGHCSIVPFPFEEGLVNNQMLMFYHSWVAEHTGGDYPRNLLMDVVTWDEGTGWPFIPTSSPSIGPQKIPT
jgi:arabinan endo-1,5-alpha-L-arabinosidase